MASLALDACDPDGSVACDQQAAFLSIPIVDSDLSLTWSSQWASARRDRPAWDASPLGLGGWSIDVIERYLPASRALVAGDGAWRVVDPLRLASGETAVPSFDGTLAYVFDAAGRHVRTVDGHLGTVLLTISYDPAGRLASVDGIVGRQPAHLEVQRAADGRPRTLVGIDGGTTTLDVDATGRLIAVHTPVGSTTQVGWTTGALVTSETDPLGGVTRLAYDAEGRLSSATDADGVVTTWARTELAAGHETRVSSASGRVTTYRTESNGGGVRRTVVGPDGATTVETADAQGGRTIAYADGTSVTIGAAGSMAWGHAAPLLTPVVETRSDGVTSRTERSEQAQEVNGSPFHTSGSVTTTVNGEAWVQTFDPTGRTVTLTDPAGRRTTEAYDAGGRPTSWTGPGSAPLAFTYDAQGRVSSETVGAGMLARRTRFTWDVSTGRITLTRPDGSKTTLAVDANGQPTGTTAADNSTVLEMTDAAGRLAQVGSPGGLSFTLGSSPAGRPTAFLPPPTATDASVETTRYDADGEPVMVSGPGTRAIGISYDTAGRLAGWTFDQGTGAASYDPTSGLLTKTADPGGVSTTYGYAGVMLDSIAWSGPLSGSVNVTLDANGRPVAETVDGADSLPLTFDGAGALTGIGGLSLSRDPASGLVTHSALGAVITDEQYDTSERLVRTMTSAGGTVVRDVRYTYDALGRIASAAETGRDGATSTTTYAYDGADRLADVAVDGRTVETDTYDPAGDRTAVSGPTGTTKATYDVRDRLLTWGAATYTWAPDGALVARTDASGRAAFTYDDLGALRAVSLPDGHAVTYLVDAAGRRVGRSVDGTLAQGYLSDPAGHVVALTDGSGALVARFAYDDLGHLALMERGGTSYRILTDPVGSPRLVVDATIGAIADAITYDARGRVTAETVPGFIPFGFVGGLRDPATGLVHLGVRDYDPATGRWTGPDPLRFSAGDPNLYRYAGDDPVNASDPSGLRPIPNDDDILGDPIGWSDPAGTQPTRAGADSNAGSSLADPPLVMLTAPIVRPPSASNPAGPPASGPGSPGPPPSGRPEGGSPPSWSCTGASCTGPGGQGSCVNGSCGSGPRGFWCKAEVCSGPGGLVCVGSQGSPCSIGDTHLWTADGVHLDFQAAGEFVALRSRDGRDVVEARQRSLDGLPAVTFNTAVAAGVAGDRVGIYAKESSSLVVNGMAVDAVDVQEPLPHGGTLERHGGGVTIGWPDGSRLVVTQVFDTLDYGFSPGPAVGPTLQGLLGSADGNPANDLTARDGTVLATSDPAFATKLYRQFGDSWRVQPGESLFDYAPGESRATFTDLAIPSSTMTVESLPPSARADAEAICRAVGIVTQPLVDDCTLDVGVTGNPGYAAAEAAIAAAGTPFAPAPATNPSESPAPTPSARPSPTPSPTPPSSSPGPLTLGREVSGAIVTAKQRDAWTFPATAGATVYLQAQGSCVPGLEWHLEAPGGGVFTYNDTCHDIGRQVLGDAGAWTVSVSSPTGTTGGYAFTVWSVPATIASTISLGQTVTGSVAAIGEWHEYTFAATAGEIVDLKAGGTTAQRTCSAGIEWALVRPDGGTQTYGPTCDDIGRQVLRVAGTWVIRVSPDAIATGSYAFSVQPGS